VQETDFSRFSQQINQQVDQSKRNSAFQTFLLFPFFSATIGPRAHDRKTTSTLFPEAHLQGSSAQRQQNRQPLQAETPKTTHVNACKQKKFRNAILPKIKILSRALVSSVRTSSWTPFLDFTVFYFLEPSIS